VTERWRETERARARERGEKQRYTHTNNQTETKRTGERKKERERENEREKRKMHAPLVLLREVVEIQCGELVRDMVHVRPTARRGDAVHKRHLYTRTRMGVNMNGFRNRFFMYVCRQNIGVQQSQAS